MNGNKKVKVKSTVNAQIVVRIPALSFRREWNRRGAMSIMTFEQLEQAIYEPGADYLFRSGILYIDDMEVKKELGLEDREAKEPTNIIVLTDEERTRAIGPLPMHEFKELVNKLSKEQLTELANFAVSEDMKNLDKAEYLGEKSGIDIIQKLRWNKEDKKAKAVKTDLAE